MNIINNISLDLFIGYVCKLYRIFKKEASSILVHQLSQLFKRTIPIPRRSFRVDLCRYRPRSSASRRGNDECLSGEAFGGCN